MPRPKQLYYSPKQSKVSHTRTPTGDLDVQQLLQGKAPWILPSTREKKCKKLILNDWTAFNWSRKHTAKVQAVLAELIDEGFTLFISQDGEIKPFTKQDLSSLYSLNVREKMQVMDAEQLIRDAMSQNSNQLTRDELFVLDDYWMQHLLQDDDTLRPRNLYYRDYVQLSQSQQGAVLEQILTTSTHPLHIIVDLFYELQFVGIQKLLEKYPTSERTIKYRKATFQNNAVSQFVTNKSLTSHGFTFSWDDLTELERLHFFETPIHTEELAAIINDCDNLEELIFFRCNINPLLWEKGKLSNLYCLDLSSSIISPEAFTQLLEAMPNLIRLNLDNTTVSSGTFKIPEGGLICLEEIELRDESINSDVAQSLIRAAPNLRKLICKEYNNINELIGSTEGNLTGRLDTLEEIDLSNGLVTTGSLSLLLKAVPQLKRLNLSECMNLGHSSGAPVRELKNLEELHLQNYDSSPFIFMSLLKAAPNLKRLFITDATPLTLEVLNQVRASRPGLEIIMPSSSNNTPSGVGEPVDPIHKPEEHKNIKPTPENVNFEFKGRNKTKNQGMIIEKMSQYLHLTQQHLALIPKIQDGICTALTRLFNDLTTEEWFDFINRISEWDGKRETPPPAGDFDRLWSYIRDYQLTPQTKEKYYLGDNLAAFFEKPSATNTTWLLANPWHAIAVKRLPNNSWLVYDPNFVNGAREVPHPELINTIHNAIGTLVSVQAKQQEVPPLINDPDAFLEQGGLLIFQKIVNPKEVLALIPENMNFSPQALEGLFFRDVAGVPAWVRGIKDPVLAPLTNKLLDQFMQNNAPNFQDALQKSMGAMKPQAKHETIVDLVPVEEPVAEPNRELLMELIRNAQDANSYEHRLKTWLKAQSQAQSLIEYLQHCMNPVAPKKQLIELSAPGDVNAMRFALERYAKNTHRPLYYIHSPDDLVCSQPYIQCNGDVGTMQKGPGGSLYDFLTADHGGVAPVVLVNYDRFSPDDLVRLNALLDSKRVADGTRVPDNALVIGLMDTNKPDCYQGSDFYSRFNRVEKCLISSDQLVASLPQLPIITESSEEEPPYVIDLFHNAHWKDRLLGHWVLDGNQLKFHQGELAKVKGRTIRIQNGPWNDPEFQSFWHSACLHGQVQHQGRVIAISANLQILQAEGYDWQAFKARVIFSTDKQTGVPINPFLLNECFSHYQYQDLNQTVVQIDGLIAAAKAAGKPLNLYLTRTLNLDQWAMLLTECQEQNVQLEVCYAPGVVIPITLREPVIEPVYAAAIWDGAVSATDMFITSTDIDTSVVLVTQEQTDWQVIDVSECTPADLFHKLDGRFDNETLQFVFNQTTSALLTGLLDKKRILLKGRFSAELADFLAPLLIERQRADETKGQVVIVSDEDSLFSHQKIVSHAVTSAEKKACLGVLTPDLDAKITPFLEHESLSTLQARCAYWRVFPEQASSDDSWIGMRHLPAMQIQADEPAAAFLKGRKQAVNEALKIAPYVLLTGPSGVGKSTFVRNNLAEPDDTLYHSEAKIREWAKDTTTTGRKLLFIDEATLSPGNWTLFEGLFNNPPSILVDGEYIPLRPEHKVIFAGNPVSYGDERRLASFFQRHGQAILFNPLPISVLYTGVLLPVFTDKERARALSGRFLAVYRFLVACSTNDILITPRELQMMALLTESHCARYPQANPGDVARFYAYSLACQLVPQNRKAEFDEHFKPAKPLIEQELRDSNAFTLTQSRLPCRQQLDDLLALRLMRQADVNNEQRYGGLGGLIFTGEPGVGKSELVFHTLLDNGFVEMHDFIAPASADKAFYRMPVSMSVTEKEALLRKVFDEGAVVLIDEINSSPMMERLLNDLLMGITPEGKRPQKPGFMVIGTQNPVTMAGRRAPSTALSRRLITMEVAEYPEHEMHSILVNKGVPDHKATAMIKAYNNNREEGIRNKLSPIPCFRDLMQLADDCIKAIPAILPQNSDITKLALAKSKLDSNSQLLAVIDRLEKGSKSRNPYWMNSSRKLAAIIDAILDCSVHNKDINAELANPTSDMSKAVNMKRITLDFFTQKVESRKIIEKEPIVKPPPLG